jgi:hypothetical protein
LPSLRRGSCLLLRMRRCIGEKSRAARHPIVFRVGPEFRASTCSDDQWTTHEPGSGSPSLRRVIVSKYVDILSVVKESRPIGSRPASRSPPGVESGITNGGHHVTIACHRGILPSITLFPRNFGVIRCCRSKALHDIGIDDMREIRVLVHLKMHCRIVCSYLSDKASGT